MAQRSGINRGFMWLRKVLQITEETDTPRVLSEIASPSIDIFGWDRHTEMLGLTTNGSLNQDFALGPAVPEGVMRVYYEASVASTDALVQTLWIEHRTIKSPQQNVAVVRPITRTGATLVTVQVGLERALVLAPGDRLVGRAAPTPDVASRVVIQTRFVDIAFGEYIEGL